MITSRLYENEQDFQQMQALVMQARRRTGDWRYAHLGELTFNFFMATCHLDPCQHIRLWYDDQGRLAAYAMLGEDPAFDWQVAPEYEWRGIEAQAWDWAQTLISDLRRRDAQRWGGPCVAGARQDDLRRISFLEALGFRYRGEFTEVNMLRLLDGPIPEPVLPAGYQVRALAKTGEVALRAAAQRQVWQPWTVGEVSDEDYAHLMRLPGYECELDVVTVAPDGVIAAYVNGWPDPLNRIGDFGPVGALEPYRRLGLTRAALLESLRRMQDWGMDRVCVSTGVDNTPAINLYQSVGFQIVNRYLDYVKVD